MLLATNYNYCSMQRNNLVYYWRTSGNTRDGENKKYTKRKLVSPCSPRSSCPECSIYVPPMNFLNLLTKEKRVAGIEISDSVVRIAFFRPHKKKQKKQLTIDTASRTNDKNTQTEKEELILIEEPIAANIIADGVVTDVELLGKTLKSIWAKARLGTDYAIVAIPDDKVYSRIFSFPKTVEGARLSEAMRLAIGFQLPIKTEDAYLDWERTGGTTTTNEILLSTVPRTVVQGYIAALELASIKTLALESHLASIARAVKLTPDRITLFSKKTPDGATIFALKNGILRFSRTLPARFVSVDQIRAETTRVKTALETSAKEDVDEQEFTSTTVRDEYVKRAELTEPKSRWLIALGAAIRGNIPAGEDNLVSLLPIGTEEAYAYQKATTFVALIRNITIGVSVFFTMAFIVAYLFMLSLSQSASRTITTLSSSPVSPELAEQESRIERVNALTETASLLLAETPVWSTVLTELTELTIDGIVVSNFSAGSLAGTMTMSGTARNRATLNQFKKLLQDSVMLADVGLPITNIAQRENLPFSISFRLKDPSVVYYK